MTKDLTAPLKLINDIDAPLRVCFVCSGNTCRSPMAAAALNHLGKGAYKCSSAGLYAVTGDAISQNSVLALKSAGIKNTPENNYESHTARQTSADIFNECDKIVAISRNQIWNLLCSYPEYAEKITVMSKDIPDPFMCGMETYESCLSLIIECLKEMFSV